MQHSTLLAQPHLSVITGDAAGELAGIRELVVPSVLVEGRGDLEALLGQLLATSASAAPPDGGATDREPGQTLDHGRTLDLIGHATRDGSLLVLGSWVIDAASTRTRAFFRELAELEVLPRLGVESIRLLGSGTATTPAGRATICRLAEILGVEVLGARDLLRAAHYGPGGFGDEHRHLLVSAAELRGEAPTLLGSLEASRSPRLFDVDALPAAPPATYAPRWPRRVATAEAARELLRLVNRSAGAEMPGLLAAPTCELALPAARPGWYHVAEVMFGGELVRVYPDGAHRPGIVYTVQDPPALRALLERLPLLPG
jgi:hypothetical protein